jgi:hypothetical protein
MSLENKFEIVMFHSLGKEGLVAEVYHNFCQWAAIFKKDETIIIQFYPHPRQEYWEFPYKEAIKILEQAKMKFLIRRNQGSFLEQAFPPDPQQVNELAEKILKEIVDHPEKKLIKESLHRFGDVVDIYVPDGKGARYSAVGEFIGFLE